MKTFLGIFVSYFVFCLIASQIVFGFMSGNFWAIIAVVALVLATLTTALVESFRKIDELEKKIEQLRVDIQIPPKE